MHRLLAFGVAMLILSVACDPPPPPGVYRGDRCAYATEILDVWSDTNDGQWAVDTAIRESGCNPCAFYPSRSDCAADPTTARGMFQLLNHRDLEDGARGHGACPWDGRWSDPHCGIIAAKFLYQQSGRAPW